VRLTAADFDRDGAADLLVSGDRVEWWLNQGDGSFAPAAEGATFGEGALSIAAGSDSRDRITVWTGNGDGTFDGPFEVFVVELDRQANLELADLHSDGRPDLVAFYRNRIVTWLNTSFRVCEEQDLPERHRLRRLGMSWRTSGENLTNRGDCEEKRSRAPPEPGRVESRYASQIHWTFHVARWLLLC
jgi:hypothetical protein